ncbi:glycosyltransferase family 2 protein [Alistipes sp. ZOR0009]|uniref:glycosyltransferase family 2 protein n=1 Tax=Alistipes sp. ZOR0009 TaxID=1339253 RepID=UPI00064836F4|nr:glycosyltransferase family 2 protein [Alistipes sp. ZOR0009]
MNRVAVIILNWNGITFLKQFLPSVIANTPAAIADIIVADNGSNDESVQHIKATHPSVQIIQFDRNYGFTGGYNKAISSINHEYTVLLNSDVEVPQGWLEPLVAEMDKNKEVGACMPKIIAQQNKDSFEYAGASGGFLDKFGYPFCRGRILSSLENDNGQYDNPTPVFWASGACLMVRTRLYRELGGLDSDFFAHMEEIDFCWRLQHEGYKVMAYPQSKVYHVGGGTLPNNNPRKMYLNFRNSLLMLTKNLPKRLLFRTLFIRMILDGAAGIVFLLQGKWSFFVSVLKAHRDFYKMADKFIEKRKSISKHSTLGLYKKSIILSYVVKGKKTFSRLNKADFIEK